MLPIVLAGLAFSVFINYVDRGNLAIAAPPLKDELGFSVSRLGILLSAFFWSLRGARNWQQFDALNLPATTHKSTASHCRVIVGKLTLPATTALPVHYG